MSRPILEALDIFIPAGPAEARVADFLRDNLYRLATLSLDDIAAAAGASQPTATRVLRGLGYRNAIELRTAAALNFPGRLHPEQVRRAAAAIASANDLFIFAPVEMDEHIHTLFNEVFKKTDVALPMKPQIMQRRTPPMRVPERYNYDDAALILAIRGLPDGFNLEMECRNARTAGAPVILLQSSNFTCDGSSLILSLGLCPSTPDRLAALCLAATVADIRMEADRQNRIAVSPNGHHGD